MICSSRNVVALSAAAAALASGIAILRKKGIIKTKDGKDSISQLPGDILISIIERIPTTKDVVQTSIIAKQWRNLYAFVPHINLNCLHTFGGVDSHYHDDRRHVLEYSFPKSFGAGIHHNRLKLQQKFIDGVDNFLRLYSGSRIISCQLSCCFTESFARSKFEGWIRSLGRLGVEQLTLKFKCSEVTVRCLYRNENTSPDFSCHLISEAPSLQFLSLTKCTLQPNMKSQPCNSLETLHLHGVNISTDAMNCILTNCVNLQSLVMKLCNLETTTLCINGTNLQLRDLSIVSCSHIEIIEIYAKNLIRFQYTHLFRFNGGVQFSFNHIPQLQILDITLPGDHLEYIFNDELKSLVRQDMFIPTRHRVNMFSNIRRLDLIYLMLPDEHSIAPVLDLCPLLQELNFELIHWLKYMMPDFSTETRIFDEEAVKNKRKYTRFHKHLKKVEFCGYSGRTREIEFALYILGSAIALEQMHVGCCFDNYTQKSSMFREEVYMHRLFERHIISKSAKITIGLCESTPFSID